MPKSNKTSYILLPKVITFILINVLLLLSLVNNVVANNSSNVVPRDPVQFLHSITDQVLTELKSHETHKNIKEINKIVDDFIMPNIDFDEMCQWITGRAIWAKTTESQRAEFITELKQLLIKTYSTTLNNYSREKIEFQNYSYNPAIKRIQIKSIVIRPGKENLAVDYRLIAKEDSWKVYDLIIEGVSILQGFRAQFSDDIKQQGIVAVTNKIKEHNKRIDA